MKPNIQKAYQETAATQWNRIEMLLALYNGVIDRLEEVRIGKINGDRSKEINGQVRAAALLAGIEMGLDDTHAPEITSRVRRLCDYCRQCLLEGDEASLKSAILVLSNLRDGFEGIREEASRLEAEGMIPPLQQSQSAGVIDDCVV